jgi:ribosomal-protein-alanine N-acetyltransferase
MINESELILKPTEVADLKHFFEFQLDEEANYAAAFTSKDPTDKIAFLKKMTTLLSDPTVNMRTIFMDNTVIGSIAKFEMEGDAEITYWIDRKYWGKGIATKALKIFLTIENARPIFGRVAFDNFRSQRVLKNCGFEIIGNDKWYANARQSEIEELIYKLL